MRKIATCCFCGTRAALVLGGEERHELACSSCGASLHDLKMLPIPAPRKPAQRPATQAKPGPKRAHLAPVRSYEKPKKRKKTKNFKRRLFAKIWDEIEDIFD